MRVEISIPRLGWNMEQGVFLAWLKKDGELVNAGDPLFSLEGDKSAQDIEALDTGILHLANNSPHEGEIVQVGQVIGLLETATAGNESGSSPVPHEEGQPVISPSLAAPLPLSESKVKTSGRLITPRARRAAKRLGIDPSSLSGTGKNGRVRERDVLANDSDVDYLAVTPTRLAIATRLKQSLAQTVPVTLTTKLDAQALTQFRQKQKAEKGAAEPIPSFNDLILWVCAKVLEQFPLLNARWEGNKIALFKKVNIGLAVDTPHGLVVPVVSEVNRLPLKALCQRTAELIKKARERALKAEDTSSGTFTLTSLGALGIDAFTPIINWPQTAILGVGRIVTEPAMVEGRVEPRPRLTLSLTFDHQVTDGAYPASFLQKLSQELENFKGVD